MAPVGRHVYSVAFQVTMPVAPQRRRCSADRARGQRTARALPRLVREGAQSSSLPRRGLQWRQRPAAALGVRGVCQGWAPEQRRARRRGPGPPASRTLPVLRTPCSALLTVSVRPAPGLALGPGRRSPRSEAVAAVWAKAATGYQRALRAGTVMPREEGTCKRKTREERGPGAG